MGKGGIRMKLLNYDSKDLILENMRPIEKQPKPSTHTKAQYKILCNLIVQKKISRRFFEFIVSELFETDDWKELDYEQVYTLIHVLTFFDYTKVRM